MPDVKERVIAATCALSDIDINSVTAETRLVDDLDMDSMDVTELVMEMEDEFNVYIPDEESEKLKTVGDIVALIERMTA